MTTHEEFAATWSPAEGARDMDSERCSHVVRKNLGTPPDFDHPMLECANCGVTL